MLESVDGTSGTIATLSDITRIVGQVASIEANYGDLGPEGVGSDQGGADEEASTSLEQPFSRDDPAYFH